MEATAHRPQSASRTTYSPLLQPRKTQDENRDTGARSTFPMNLSSPSSFPTPSTTPIVADPSQSPIPTPIPLPTRHSILCSNYSCLPPRHQLKIQSPRSLAALEIWRKKSPSIQSKQTVCPATKKQKRRKETKQNWAKKGQSRQKICVQRRKEAR